MDFENPDDYDDDGAGLPEIADERMLEYRPHQYPDVLGERVHCSGIPSGTRDAAGPMFPSEVEEIVQEHLRGRLVDDALEVWRRLIDQPEVKLRMPEVLSGFAELVGQKDHPWLRRVVSYLWRRDRDEEADELCARAEGRSLLEQHDLLEPYLDAARRDWDEPDPTLRADFQVSSAGSIGFRVDRRLLEEVRPVLEGRLVRPRSPSDRRRVKLAAELERDLRQDLEEASARGTPSNAREVSRMHDFLAALRISVASTQSERVPSTCAWAHSQRRGVRTTRRSLRRVGRAGTRDGPSRSRSSTRPGDQCERRPLALGRCCRAGLGREATELVSSPERARERA
jgi:hypothetical protein